MTHVVGEHQTLAWFVKAFDKEGRALGACIPRPLSRPSNYQSGSLGGKERIPFVDILSVCLEVSVWILDSPKHPHPNAQISGLGASHTHTCQRRTDTHLQTHYRHPLKSTHMFAL